MLLAIFILPDVNATIDIDESSLPTPFAAFPFPDVFGSTGKSEDSNTVVPLRRFKALTRLQLYLPKGYASTRPEGQQCSDHK